VIFRFHVPGWEKACKVLTRPYTLPAKNSTAHPGVCSGWPQIRGVHKTLVCRRRTVLEDGFRHFISGGRIGSHSSVGYQIWPYPANISRINYAYPVVLIQGSSDYPLGCRRGTRGSVETSPADKVSAIEPQNLGGHINADRDTVAQPLGFDSHNSLPVPKSAVWISVRPPLWRIWRTRPTIVGKKSCSRSRECAITL